MPLSWNEIKDRALRFSREWADEANEHAEAKSFWDDFFNIFGVSRRRQFRARVKSRRARRSMTCCGRGYCDRAQVSATHRAHTQGATLPRPHRAELPRYLLVSDFANFRLYDLEGEEAPAEFRSPTCTAVRLFGFIAGYRVRSRNGIR